MSDFDKKFNKRIEEIKEMFVVSQAMAKNSFSVSEENKQLKIRADAGYELSKWAAVINWNGKKNTKDWLGGLRERIEKVQALKGQEK